MEVDARKRRSTGTLVGGVENWDFEPTEGEDVGPISEMTPTILGRRGSPGVLGFS